MSGRADSSPAVTKDQTILVLLALDKGLRINRTEQALASHFTDVLRRHFPRLRGAVRIFAEASMQIKASAVTEELPGGHISSAPVTLDACSIPAGMQIPPAWLEGQGLTLADQYAPVFSADGAGVALPLLVAQDLVGIVNVEWDPKEEERPPTPTIRAMVQLLEGAVINRRLASDASFFRGRMKRIIANANALIFMIDAQRRVIMFNKALARITGQRAEQVLGSDLLDWLQPDHHEDFCAALSRALGGDWVSNFEMRYIDGSGGTVRALFNLASLTDLDDPALTVIGIGQECAAFKILEHQVIQAEKLATLGQLAAGIVHEINNPLTSISVYTDFLTKKVRSGGGDPSDLSMLKKIMDGADRILKCARDLVNYAKPTRARLEDQSLNEILEQAISFCEHILRGSEATLRKDLAADNPRCFGVQDQLQQLFINLITNACHALPPGGGEVRVSSHLQGEGLVAARISDTGKGIEPSDLQQIFEPFFTTKRPGEGTGLGLSIVQRIVDFHHGSIEVNSVPEEGTTFTVTLPSGKID